MIKKQRERLFNLKPKILRSSHEILVEKTFAFTKLFSVSRNESSNSLSGNFLKLTRFWIQKLDSKYFKHFFEKFWLYF